MFTIMCLPYLATQMYPTQFGYFSGVMFFGNGSMYRFDLAILLGWLLHFGYAKIFLLKE